MRNRSSAKQMYGQRAGAFATFSRGCVAGMIVDATGSYTLAFVSGGLIVASAAICYWFAVNKPITED